MNAEGLLTLLNRRDLTRAIIRCTWSGARPADTFDADIAKVSAIAPGSRATLPTYAFALSPDARAELSLRGTITPDDLELLRDHIELTIKALARKAKAVEQ